MKRISWFDLFLVAIGRRRKYRIKGNSMSPALENRDVVLIKPCKSFQVGDIVLAWHPYQQSIKILKRIESVAPDGKLTLIGDKPEESSDSRVFGKIDIRDVIGKVVAKSD